MLARDAMMDNVQIANPAGMPSAGGAAGCRNGSHAQLRGAEATALALRQTEPIV